MKKVVLSYLCIVLASSAFADSPAATRSSPASLLSVSLTPDFSIPLGADASVFGLGGGITISGQYRLPFLPLLFLGAGLGYSYTPLQAATSLSMVHAGLHGGLRWDILDNFSLRAFGSAGYSYNFLNDSSGSGATPFVGVGTDLTWAFSPILSLCAGAGYDYFFDLYSGLAVTLGISYNLPSGGTQPAQLPKQETIPAARPEPRKNAPQPQPPTKVEGVVIEKLSLDSIFPILHTYYDSNPIGTLVLRNTEKTTASDVDVSIMVRQFMDAPKECASVSELKPGEECSVSLFALFKNNVFEIKQSTKAPAEITVSYKLDDKPQTLNKVETLKIYDRNAMSWDDTNKAAAFVMPKEPAVLMLSNQINSFIKSKMNRAFDANLQTAIAFHEALRLLGIAYVSPPLTSYAVVSQNKTAVDSVKFPLETIQYRSGDCSDLSILYSSLLESVQVETAFITIPGHIFMAFALASSEDQVRKTFSHTDEFIFRSGKVWVPVEVTERDGGFLTAWQTGAREWRENLAKKQADFYPVRAAWETYEPVNYPGIGSQPPLPDAGQVVKNFQEEVARLVAREIYDKETELLAEVSKSNNSPKALNALGVLYARYDLDDKAELQFQAAVKATEFVYALVNLGNLRLREKRVEEALGFYQRAAKVAPHDPLVLLGLARSNHELQNYGIVKAEYEELKLRNPELAAQFAYLRLQGEEATRAADSSRAAEILVWGEEK